MQQLFAVEVVLKLLPGLLLLVAPKSTSKLIGLPHDELGVWPRLFGAVLVGIGVAALLAWRGTTEISIATLVAVNLMGAVAIVSALILKRAARTWRGRWVLSGVACILSALLLFEISYL